MNEQTQAAEFVARETHFSVDIETLATSSDAVIISLGACQFDPTTGDIGNHTFYEKADPSDQNGRYLDLKTIQFWIAQQKEIPWDGKMNLRMVLTEFSIWMDKYTEWLNPESNRNEFFYRKERKEKIRLWVNGQDFDMPILASAYRQYQKDVPWNYNSGRDIRTLASLFPEVPKPTNPNSHHALSDALTQAQWVIDIYKARAEQQQTIETYRANLVNRLIELK